MKPGKSFFSVILLLTATIWTSELSQAAGHNDTDSASVHSFQASITTGNNQISTGKKLGSNVFFVKPDLHYTYKESLFADLACSYFPSFNKSSIDNFAIGIGYTFNLGTSFSTSLGYTYTDYFSKKEVMSSAPNELEGSLGWDNTILSPSLDISYYFGATHDFSTGIDLTHTFDFEHLFTKSDKFSLPAGVSISFASANFYQEYVKNNKVKSKAKTKGKEKEKSTSTDSTTIDYTTINTNFSLSDITMTTGFTYSIAGLDFTPAISYLIPFHQPTNLASSRSIIVNCQIAYSF